MNLSDTLHQERSISRGLLPWFMFSLAAFREAQLDQRPYAQPIRFRIITLVVALRPAKEPLKIRSMSVTGFFNNYPF